MKPIKERIKIYFMIFVFGLFGILALLLTGHDYTRARGFFVSDKREAMSLSESIIALPKEYLWFALAFIMIFFIVEIFIFIAKFITNKFFK